MALCCSWLFRSIAVIILLFATLTLCIPTPALAIDGKYLESNFINRIYTGTNDIVTCSAIQPDGKILIGGLFSTYKGVARGKIARLNSDGSLDTSFLATGVGANGNVYSIAILPDGNILIGGDFTTYNGVARGYIARLNSDGTLDTSFLSTGSGANNYINSFAILPDGKILIDGYFQTYNGVAKDYVARLNSDGSLDVGFLSTGTEANYNVYSTVILPDGKILVGGSLATYNGVTKGYVARLNSDGSLDNSFISTGASTSGIVYSLVVLPDGKILIGGSINLGNGVMKGYVARLNSDGSLDNSFISTGASAYSYVRSLAILSDDKLLVGGSFATSNGVVRGKVMRLNSDGNLDTSFLAIDVGASYSVYSLAVLPDGKVLIGLDITTYNGVVRGYVARLNSDGSFDSNFLSTGVGVSYSVYSLSVLPDGKILIGGDFTTYNGVSNGYISRLNSDGTLDTSFLSTGAGASGTVNSLAIQSNSRILVREALLAVITREHLISQD
ncbi:MAG: delta-60 repeat domain-containing protein [bacterium]